MVIVRKTLHFIVRALVLFLAILILLLIPLGASIPSTFPGIPRKFLIMASSASIVVAFFFGFLLSHHGLKYTWHASRYIAAHALYFPAQLLNRIYELRRFIITFVVLPLTPFALFGFASALDSHSRMSPAQQLLAESADFLNFERLEAETLPQALPVVRRLIARYSFFSTISNLYPGLSTFFDALGLLYPEDLSLTNIPHEQFDDRVNDAIRRLESQPLSQSDQAHLLCDTLLLRLYLRQSKQGANHKYVAAANRVLQRIEESISSSKVPTSIQVPVHEAVQNIRARLLTYCAMAPQNSTITMGCPEGAAPETYWKKAEQIFQSISDDNNVSFFARSRAQNNYADHLLHKLWLALESEGTRSSDASLGNDLNSLFNLRSSLETTIRTAPLPEAMITIAQIDVLLAVSQTVLRTSNRGLPTQSSCLESALRYLDMGLACGAPLEAVLLDAHMLRLCPLFHFDLPESASPEIKKLFDATSVKAYGMLRERNLKFQCTRCIKLTTDR